MENLNGIKLQSHDMKRDGNEILYFKQLQKSTEKQGKGNPSSNVLQEKLFNQYDYLLVTPENEILGVKGENSELIYRSEEAYKLAQGMFVSG